MVGIHTMLRHPEKLRHPKIWRFCCLTAIALGAGSWLSLAIATPTFSQTPKTPTASPPTPTRSLLKTGSQGTEVVELQGILKLLGYYTESVNGSYDPPTAIAVTKFQKAAGLPADGIVGLETWNRLLPPSPTVTSAAPTSSSSPANSFPIPSGSQTQPQTPAKPPATAAPAKTTTAKPATSSASTAKPELVTLPILRIGMQGSAVTGLQERLRALGFLKSAADGVFGAETQAAVKAAQTKFNLASDGVVGAGTWLALMR